MEEPCQSWLACLDQVSKLLIIPLEFFFSNNLCYQLVTQAEERDFEMEKKQQPPPLVVSPVAEKFKTEEHAAPLHIFGFEFDHISPSMVTGRLLVTPNCCQPFKVLHGGVSALIAEALASTGAYYNCGRKRIAGIHLSIHHMKSAQLGDLVLAQAIPLSAGRTIQAWEVKLWKVDPISMESKYLLSSSRVTLRCNLPVPDDFRGPSEPLRKQAKL